jgi:hypothetical protein
MLFVNTTYQISEPYETEWRNWVLEEYAPEVTQSGILNNPVLLRLLIENEPGAVSYALQFEVDDLDALEAWFEKYGKQLQQTLTNRFDDKVVGFTTLMEKIERK